MNGEQLWHKLGKIEGKQDQILEKLGGLPCVKHGEEIAKLKVKSSIWGGIGAGLVMAGIYLKEKLGL